MTRSLVIMLLAAALSLTAAGGILARWHDERAAGANALDAAGDVGIGHPIYALDPRDDRALAAYATDIFIGRVLVQTGAIGAPTSAPGQDVPQSQFAVDVLHAVKGGAEGVVTVNQVGGLDRQARRIMLLEGDALLRPGASELFLVVHVPELGWYQIVAAGHGHRAAGDAAEREALIDRFRRASGPATGSASPGTRPEGERA